jgi:hypothetical protein
MAVRAVPMARPARRCFKVNPFGGSITGTRARFCLFRAGVATVRRPGSAMPTRR